MIPTSDVSLLMFDSAVRELVGEDSNTTDCWPRETVTSEVAYYLLLYSNLHDIYCAFQNNGVAIMQIFLEHFDCSTLVLIFIAQRAAFVSLFLMPSVILPFLLLGL